MLLFVGTGTNCCYVEDLEKVELWTGDMDEPRKVSQWLCIQRQVMTSEQVPRPAPPPPRPAVMSLCQQRQGGELKFG